MFEFFISCPRYTEDLLIDELSAIGATPGKITHNGVIVKLTQYQAYQCCYTSRVANRLLRKLEEFPVDTVDEIYESAVQFDWKALFGSCKSFMVMATTAGKTVSLHTQFLKQRTKDAIVDHFVGAGEKRPDVDRDNPAIIIHVHVEKGRSVLYLDYAGAPLHQRGYRAKTVSAPLKENLAAVVALRIGRDALISNTRIIDPFCGSGTLLIEAAMLIANIPPGRFRDEYAFHRHPDYDDQLWQRVLDESTDSSLSEMPVLYGTDMDRKAVQAARENITNAGLQEYIQISQQDALKCLEENTGENQLILANPPYGERISSISEVDRLYQNLSDVLKQSQAHNKVAFLVASESPWNSLSLRADKRNHLMNGAIECELIQARIFPKREIRPEDFDDEFSNRLRKKNKAMKKWAEKEGVYCYRVYDADLPQYAVAIDRYEDWVVIQEYQAPAKVNQKQAAARLRGITRAVPYILDVPVDHVVVKTRARQKGAAQYRKLDSERQWLKVRENNLQFWVNLHDYLDTGLFLDHRDTRAMIANFSDGKKVLNLFSYTASIGVYAASGGATKTTNVDLSNTYLDWAKRNYQLNNFNVRQHEFIKADCVEWMNKNASSRKFDLIVIDPPTFSNTKKADLVFDVQKDYVQLIQNALKMLPQGGLIFFSTNFRKFKFDNELFDDVEITDLSLDSIPRDFERNPKIHYLWKIEKR